MKTLQEIQNEYLAIDFFLSMSCNKNCHYCTSYTLEMRNLTVDMDFLKQTLGYLKKYKVRVNLLGGEPGLIKNLDEVISEITVPVGPIEIPIDMGYTGELAARLNANLNAWTNELSATPTVNANLYIESVLDAQVAEAKFGGDLLLANEEIELATNASLDMSGDSASLAVSANAGHNLEALKGKVFVSGSLKLDEPKEFYKELINFEGYTHNKNFYSIDKTVEL